MRGSVLRGLRKLHNGRRGRMIETRHNATQETFDMQLITPEDAQQVHAILTTHAEMQDAHAMRSMEVLGRLKADSPNNEDMIDELECSILIAEEDSENLKRIARFFQGK